MKKQAFVLAALLALSSTVLGACTRVSPGYVGIQVSYAGTNRGVSDYPTTAGWVVYNPAFSTVLEWPTFVQTAKWTASATEGSPNDESITFTDKDKMQYHADVSLSYHLNPALVPAFYVKFRTENMDLFTHGYLRNVARDKFDTLGGQYNIDQIMGDNAEFLNKVRAAIAKEVLPVGVEIDQFGLIGAPRPPAQIQTAINRTAESQAIAKTKENELRQAQADAAKVVAKADGDAKAKLVWAQAEAEANKKLSESLSPNVLESQRLRLLQEKWNGALPTVNGVGVNPFYGVTSK